MERYQKYLLENHPEAKIAEGFSIPTYVYIL